MKENRSHTQRKLAKNFWTPDRKKEFQKVKDTLKEFWTEKNRNAWKHRALETVSKTNEKLEKKVPHNYETVSKTNEKLEKKGYQDRYVAALKYLLNTAKNWTPLTKK